MSICILLSLVIPWIVSWDKKKRPNALKRAFSTIQTHTTTYLSYIYFFLKNQKKKEDIFISLTFPFYYEEKGKSKVLSMPNIYNALSIKFVKVSIFNGSRMIVWSRLFNLVVGTQHLLLRQLWCWLEKSKVKCEFGINCGVDYLENSIYSQWKRQNNNNNNNNNNKKYSFTDLSKLDRAWCGLSTVYLFIGHF